jgi:serine protease AprX
VDTGIDAGHNALDHAPIVAWIDYVNGRAEPYDDHGHGSHVAGIIVGNGGGLTDEMGGFNLHGAAQGASLIVVKAIASTSQGRSEDVIKGIDFAREKKADVICLSLGSQTTPLNLVSDGLRDAVNRALDSGILVVASAGNTGPDNDDVESPASIQGVIAVGAVDESRRVADFSSKGNNAGFIAGVGQRTDPNKKPEILAPGVDIKGAWANGNYAVASGTSQAAPFVCGGLALMLEANPTVRADDRRSMVDNVKEKIKSTAEPIPGQATPHDERAGYGLFDANALSAAV